MKPAASPEKKGPEPFASPLTVSCASLRNSARVHSSHRRHVCRLGLAGVHVSSGTIATLCLKECRVQGDLGVLGTFQRWRATPLRRNTMPRSRRPQSGRGGRQMRKIFLVLASMAVASTAAVSLAGQSQAAPNQNPDIEAQRKLIREVADTLRKRSEGRRAG